MTNGDILFKLHEAVANEFLKRIQNGTATPADLNGATKFLKDNGIQLEVKSDKDPMSILLDAIVLEEQQEKKQLTIKKKTQEEETIDKLIKDSELEDLLRD